MNSLTEVFVALGVVSGLLVFGPGAEEWMAFTRSSHDPSVLPAPFDTEPARAHLWPICATCAALWSGP